MDSAGSSKKHNLGKLVEYEEVGKYKKQVVENQMKIESEEVGESKKKVAEKQVKSVTLRTSVSIPNIIREILGVGWGNIDTLGEAVVKIGKLFSSSFVVAACLNQYLGHTKFLTIDNCITGSVLVKFENADDLESVDGMAFTSALDESFIIRKVNSVKAHPSDATALFSDVCAHKVDS